MELERRDIELPDGTVRNQLSTVHIKKCRYLEQSGCVGMCVNMCKVRSCWAPTYVHFMSSESAYMRECACSACCIL